MRTMKWALMFLAFSGGTAWAETWVKCADEGGTCRFDGVRRVAFGVDQKWAYRNLENSAQCNASVFGSDPAPGKRKRCRYQAAPSPIGYLPAPPAWATCAQEGGTCNLDGKHKVAFGTGSQWVMETFIGGIECSTGVFGDPAPGKRKECRFLGTASGGTGTALPVERTAEPAPKWTACANEGGTCRFSGRRKVAFGKGSNWNIKVFENGVQCTRENFGDPIIGVAKVCQYDSGSTVGR